VCYAYRDDAFEELLLSHLIGVGSCCKERWELGALSSKISRALKLSLDGVRSAILLSSLLHDLGKAAQMFQERCSQGRCTEFYGHYLISAFLMHLALNTAGVLVEGRDVSNFIEDRLDDIDRDKIIGILTILPIAFHHYHQVEGFRSYSLRDSLRNFVEKPKIWGRCMDDLDLLTKSISTYMLSSTLSKAVANLPSTLSNLERPRDSGFYELYRGSRLFIENFYHNIVERGVRLMAVTLSGVIIESITGLVNLCDGYVAYRARSRAGGKNGRNI